MAIARLRRGEERLCGRRRLPCRALRVAWLPGGGGPSFTPARRAFESHTFELAKAFAEWPYRQTPVFVLSSRMHSLPVGIPETVHLSREAPANLVARLSAQGFRHLYIDGGVTIQRFVSEALIDEVTITRIPVLIGTGRPLFGPLRSDARLEHISTRAFDFGFVQLQ